MVPRAVQVQRLKQELAQKKQQQLSMLSVNHQRLPQNATHQQQGLGKTAVGAVVGTQATAGAHGNEENTDLHALESTGTHYENVKGGEVSVLIDVALCCGRVRHNCQFSGSSVLTAV